MEARVQVLEEGKEGRSFPGMLALSLSIIQGMKHFGNSVTKQSQKLFSI